MSRILVVDDDAAMCAMLRANLGRRGFDVVSHGAPREAFDALRTGTFDVVVTDLNMPGVNGIELCERIVADRPDIPVVVITAFGSLDTAIAAIRAGAYDFVPKPFEMDALVVALQRAIQHRALREEVTRLRSAVSESHGPHDIIGESAAMREVYDLLDRMKDSDACVVLSGESGTGKELVARALHRAGRRKDRSFVAINCAAVPETLIESELFGHVRGAFTDAKDARSGVFMQADGGTLFLDEIGEMPISLQPKLLRALQEREVRPLGARSDVSFDVRLIVATNRDLEASVEEGRFREDLYYRINVLRIHLPPLRARGNDILLLAQHFLRRYVTRTGKGIDGISAAAAERLLTYGWPGNVRELQNCMERAVALARYTSIAVEDLPEKIRDYTPTQFLIASDDPSELRPMDEIERRYIARVLESTKGNKTVAARILGFDRTTLYRKMARYGLEAEGGDA